MKVFGSAATCLLLGASLGACKVYDRGLVSSSPPAATQGKIMMDSGLASSPDAAGAGAARGAGNGSAGNVSRPIAAEGGSAAESASSRSAAPARAREPVKSSLDDSSDSGTEAPEGRPSAADGGGATDAGCAGDGGCGRGWHRHIAVDGAQVSEALNDFPVLLRINDPHLQRYAAVGGEDIYFTADDARTLLDFEIESYDPRGELVAWVRIPTLTPGVDTKLYLAYGDGSSGRAKPSAVWSSDYHHVWHLAEDPSAGDAAIRDSTERAHGTPQGSMNADALISGVAGAGLEFDGVDDEISFFNDLWGSGPSTFSGWVKQRGSLGEYGTSMISLGDGSSDGSARFLFSRAEDGKVKCGFFGDDDLTTAVLPLNDWKYLSWTWDGHESAVYIDAVRVLGPATHAPVATSGLVGKLGNSSFRFQYFMYGQLDELHVATTARSSAWIAAEYANQRPGSSFIKPLGEPQ